MIRPSGKGFENHAAPPQPRGPVISADKPHAMTEPALAGGRLPADAIVKFPHTGLSAPYAKSMFSQYTLCRSSRRLRCVAGPLPATGCRISPEAGDNGKTSHDYDQGA